MISPISQWRHSELWIFLLAGFIVFHKFQYAVPSFSLNSRKSFISLFLPWPGYHQVESCFVGFLLFFHCCYSRPALVCGDLKECMGLIQSFCIYWDLFCVWLYGKFQRRYHEMLRRRHILLLWDEMFYRYLLNMFGSWLLLSLFRFCFYYLSIGESRMLTSPTIALW